MLPEPNSASSVLTTRPISCTCAHSLPSLLSLPRRRRERRAGGGGGGGVEAAAREHGPTGTPPSCALTGPNNKEQQHSRARVISARHSSGRLGGRAAAGCGRWPAAATRRRAAAALRRGGQGGGLRRPASAGCGRAVGFCRGATGRLLHCRGFGRDGRQRQYRSQDSCRSTARAGADCTQEDERKELLYKLTNWWLNQIMLHTDWWTSCLSIMFPCL